MTEILIGVLAIVVAASIWLVAYKLADFEARISRLESPSVRPVKYTHCTSCSMLVANYNKDGVCANCARRGK